MKKNVIPMSRIDDAVERILRIKFILGLFENPIADLTLVDQIGSQVHCSISLKLFFLLYLFNKHK